MRVMKKSKYLLGIDLICREPITLKLANTIPIRIREILRQPKKYGLILIFQC